MKKLLTICLLALAALFVPSMASAQDAADILNQLATEMNKSISPEDGLASVTVEKGNLVFTATESFLTDDDKALLAATGNNTDFLIPLVKGGITKDMPAEDRSMMAQMLQALNASMVYRVPFNGTNIDVVITAQDLMQ